MRNLYLIEGEKIELTDILKNILPSLDLVFYRGFLDWSFIFWGQRIKQITGYDPQEFSTGRKNWKDIVFAEDLEKIITITREAIKHKKLQCLRTYRIVTASGEIRWISDRGSLIYDSNGELLWIDGIIFDITKEKQLELTLEKGKQEWQLTFDSVPNPIVIAEPSEHSCIYSRVNKAFADRLGLHPRDIVKKRCKDILGGSLFNDLPMLSKSKVTFERDVEVPALGGYFHVTNVPVLDSKGNIEKVICLFTDITNIKKIEENLKTLTRELSFVIDSVSVVVIGVNEQGIVYRWNRVAEKIFMTSASDILGRPLKELSFPGDFTSRLIPAYEQCLETKRPVQIDEIRLYSEEETRILNFSIKPFFTPDNRLCFFITGFDVTNQKNLEMMLVHSQKLEAIGTLAAGIAHEINTPCQCVLSNLNFIREEIHQIMELVECCKNLVNSIKAQCSDDGPLFWLEKIGKIMNNLDLPFLMEEIPQALSQSLDCLQRVIKIIDSIREFSHPGSQTKIVTDIHKLLESVVTISRNEWKYVANVEFDFDPSIPPILCYPGELSQVFLNLIVNAAQAIKEAIGDRPENKGSITIRTKRKDPWCVVSVTDTGTGIPKEIRHKVFEPFFTTKPVGKGTGQGLAIAQAVIMKKHNGHIYFETKEGKGTTFFVLLPLGEIEKSHDIIG
ncbi:MAG: PAS domain-containing protein [Thermodesulforhabdaceae bacterium]